MTRTSVLRSSALLAAVTMVLVSCLLPTVSDAQQFYPNGRYGRRDAMPALSEISGNREMTVSFFGDGVVQCVYTGYSDYYRCSRKLGTNQPAPSVVD